MTANDKELLAERFESNRRHLRAVAYRMLGSLSEADDAVQEAWLRLSRTDASAVENLGGWLTTVVARVCLDMLRSRTSRREEPLAAHFPDPIVSRDGDPAQQTLLADSVGLALLVVLQMLPPAERLAFVLHDMFAMPFEEIAPIVDRSPTAARQLASRARRRVQGAAVPDVDLDRQREVVDAFFAASHAGDFGALVAVLDPEVVLRFDRGGGKRGEVRGAEKVAKQSLTFRRAADARFKERRAMVNGAPGVVLFVDGQPFSVLGFTVAGGKVIEIDILADPARLARLDLTLLDG